MGGGEGGVYTGKKKNNNNRTCVRWGVGRGVFIPAKKQQQQNLSEMGDGMVAKNNKKGT